MQWPVGSRIGDVQEERLVGRGKVAKILYRLLADRGGNVVSFGHVAHGAFALHQAERIEVIYHSPDDAIKLLKPAPRGITALFSERDAQVELVIHPANAIRLALRAGQLRQVPFTRHRRRVTAVAEVFG